MIEGKIVCEALDSMGNKAGCIKRAIDCLAEAETWVNEHPDHEAAEPLRALVDGLGSAVTAIAAMMR